MLDKYRDEIDMLDNQIIKLLDERFKVTKKVGDYKRKKQINVLNKGREEAIVNRIKEMNLTNEEQILELYSYMMDVSKRQQDE